MLSRRHGMAQVSPFGTYKGCSKSISHLRCYADPPPNWICAQTKPVDALLQATINTLIAIRACQISQLKSDRDVGTGSVRWERFCLLKEWVMPLECGKFDVEGG